MDSVYTIGSADNWDDVAGETSEGVSLPVKREYCD